mmetsp:Transcript_26832/g.25704  ORF Transcript_26832/g.25704 Transcript_26832/m.25704 type:complete len:90 (-) Transcript_26832:167-436(-)
MGGVIVNILFGVLFIHNMLKRPLLSILTLPRKGNTFVIHDDYFSTKFVSCLLFFGCADDNLKHKVHAIRDLKNNPIKAIKEDCSQNKLS